MKRFYFLSHTSKLIGTMLNYVKIILSKVSFDKALFEKELRKAIAMLVPAEVEDLRKWCIEKFGHLYRRIISKCFVVAGY